MWYFNISIFRQLSYEPCHHVSRVSSHLRLCDTVHLVACDLITLSSRQGVTDTDMETEVIHFSSNFYPALSIVTKYFYPITTNIFCSRCSYELLSDDRPHAVQLLLAGRNLTMRVDGGVSRYVIFLSWCKNKYYII